MTFARLSAFTLVATAMLAPLGSAQTWPGTREGLALLTGIGRATPDGGPLKSAVPGQSLSLVVENRNPTLDGAPLLLGVGILPVGGVPRPSLPGLVFDFSAPLLADAIGIVSAAPTEVRFALPAGQYTASVFLQAIAVPAGGAVANGLFASTDAHRIDVTEVPFLRDTLRLVGDDTAAEDNFGRGVAIDGGLAMVGAPGNDNGNGAAAGAAYVFDVATGAQMRKLVATNGAASDTFGDNLVLRGGQAVIAAPRHDGAALLAGALYVFDAVSGQQRRRILPIQSVSAGLVGQALGSSTAIGGGFFVAGARGDVARANGGGSLYIYDARSTNRIAKLFPNDPALADNFGFRVAVSADVFVATAPFDDDHGADSGSAYVFAAGSGRQVHKLLAPDGAAGDLFGIDIAIDGASIVVGAAFADRGGRADAGAAYVYDAGSGALVATLVDPAPTAHARFGEGVAIGIDHILVAAPIGLDDDGEANGVIYVYDRHTFVHIATLVARAGRLGDGLGQDLAISGTTVIAGAQGADDRGNLSGAAYVFQIP